MECRKEMPQFEVLQKKYGKSVKIIALNLGVNEDIKAIEDTIREFGLTMTLAMDKRGDLAQAFQVHATPYHLLFDRDMNLIFRGYKADETLANKIDLVSRVKPVDLLDAGLLAETGTDLKLNLDDGKVHALFFTATWCDWYLKASRPEYSRRCVAAQNKVNELTRIYPEIVWNVVLSRLWTGNKELMKYRKRYSIPCPVSIDKNNSLFHKFSIRDFPTLILIRNGKVSQKLTDLNDEGKLNELIKYIISWRRGNRAAPAIYRGRN